MSQISEHVTPARIAAALTALSPFIANSFGEISKQDPAVQCVIYGGLFLTGVTFMVCYTRWISQLRTTELAVGAQTTARK